MMWQEFMEIAGYEVSLKDYEEIIEPMYMAVDLSKQEFVKVIDKKRFALKTEKELIKAMRKEAKHQLEILGTRMDYDSQERVSRMARELVKRFYGATDNWFVECDYEFPNGRGCTYQARVKIFTRGDLPSLIKTIELV